jgi:hypothetical protein
MAPLPSKVDNFFQTQKMGERRLSHGWDGKMKLSRMVVLSFGTPSFAMCCQQLKSLIYLESKVIGTHTTRYSFQTASL